ncbi:protein kinase [Pelotomaculum terephthalicicum JT]|uniref:protein kinase domain-containing protein n=1 Tax=Pelotomaculum TaxID=191373 RepID=UPI0009D0FE2A|nr:MULTISPECIES: protein kinase [Pelotomaculum]MCG9967316.1 protein kinase [Pelotomaculum terephthalicicum JT]OPX89398.1 MAG: Serine/threonine-protein kinase PrkC [Pelotomaculum sp. PtaB.Bin117]OPY61789.1 MAG: Serine/threonine-protein kinase PrkC [Pelotomaculum sp. PtaU1.Bin065]
MVIRLFHKDTVYSPSQKIGEYTVLKIIGEGRYGICYLVCDHEKQYILKQLKKGMLKKSRAKAGYEEKILKTLKHECIPGFIKKIEQEKCYGYVLEYKEGNTFEELIFAENYVFGREEICRIGEQVISILKYLHGSNIVHRDIRVPNTLYDGNKVSLIDFGLARWIDEKRYTVDVDFSYLGDFLLHLYYTSFEPKDNKKKAWYEELDLQQKEILFLKKLMGIEDRYKSIQDVERDFKEL